MVDLTDSADELDLDLPDLGEQEGEEADGVEDEAAVEINLVEDQGDPFDDAVADDVPLDVEIHTEATEPTVVGDDALGIDGSADDDVTIHEEPATSDRSTSMIDEGRGHAEEGVDFIGDDELGIDPIPTEVDDGGHEGLDDAAGERVDEHEFPPLDGADDDDEAGELDVGVDIDTD